MVKIIHTLETVKNHFEREGCTLLSTEYKNSAQRLKYICKCGVNGEVTYQGFGIRKSGCKNCIIQEAKASKPIQEPKKRSVKRRIEFETVKQEFEDAGCTLLSKEYINNREKLEYICSCGQRSEKTYNCFQYKKGCMKCSGNPKYTYEQVKEFFQERECILISTEYQGISKILDYTCSCKNTSKITLTNLLAGHRCRNCRTYHREYTKESVREYFEENGYELHDDYIEFDSKMTSTCPNGHSYDISWRRFKDGKRCFCNNVDEILVENEDQVTENIIQDIVIENSIFGVGVSQQVQCKLLEEMNNEFTDSEQRMFVNNFYMYMNYHQTDDYVVDLDKVYQFIGITRRDNAKRLLVNNFTENIDYKITILHSEYGKFAGEKIMLNVDTFKNLCMIARTEKAKQIRKYYVKLENINNKIIKNSIEASNLLFNQDQINTSNKLVEHFGDKKDIFYMFSFKYLQEWYAKFGIVGEIREFHKRILEHRKEFEDICFHTVLQCSNVYKIESEFKDTALHSLNKVKIPKKSGGFHVEILKLSEIVTTKCISEEMIKVAGDRVLDPPPEYIETYNNSLEIEKEKTKRLEIESHTKIRLAEIALEMEKLKYHL